MHPTIDYFPFFHKMLDSAHSSLLVLATSEPQVNQALATKSLSESFSVLDFCIESGAYRLD